MNITKRAFTLVEILVSMTIFMSMMALMGNVFYRTNKVTRQSLSVLEMFQRAEGVNRLIAADFEYLMSTCAMQIDTDQEPQSVTFMSSLVHNPDTDGSFFSFEDAKDPGLTWVRWEWDNSNASVKRATSRRTIENDTQLLSRYTISSGKLHENNRRPTPQQEFVFFEGDSSVAPATGFSNPRKTRHVIYEDVINVPANNTFAETDIRFRNEFQNYYLGTLAIVGNNTSKVSAGVYAVRNPDGLTYNKDKANLVGALNNSHYPTQLADVTSNIEMFYIEFLKRDGITLITTADENDTLKDGNASIDISGIDLSARYAGQHSKRPFFVNVSYLLHDIPNDVLAENSNDPLIVELRNRVLNDATLNDPNSAIQMNNRRQALIDLIEDYGFNAIVIFRSIRLPL